MSIISDVQDLYGGLHGVWGKSQAHVISHLGIALIVFGIYGVTLPSFALPSISANDIQTNQWFKLAKDIGVVYVAFLVPVILIAAYAAVLRVLGQWLLTITMLVFPPHPDQTRKYRLLNSWVLEPFALLLTKEEFDFSDLLEKARELIEGYQARKKGEWAAYDQSLAAITKTSTIYLSDTLVFLLGWITLHKFSSRTAFVAANVDRFWPVTLTLIALVWLLWFRVSRALATVPALKLIVVSMILQADPEMANVRNAPEDRRDRVRSRIDKLLSDYRAERKPSLWRYLANRHRLPGSTDPVSCEEKRVRGRPFPSLYELGARFSWDEEINGKYNAAWLQGYGAYCYYQLHKRVVFFGKGIAQMVRYLVIGIP